MAEGSLHRFLLLVFVLLWVSCCTGCGTVPTANAPHRALAAELESETVALVVLTESGRPRTFCAGVWISPHAFLTAAHCVEHLGQSPADELLEALGIVKPLDPVGQRALFAQLGDMPGGYWTGTVARFDKANDLGLVFSDDPYPPHSWARVSESDISDGDRVEVVGHPVGYGWSYAEGYVSAVRLDEPNADDIPMPTLQIAAPISHGNSGGGCFDISGRLIGIGSYVNSGANGMGFFVHRDAIKKFLNG